MSNQSKVCRLVLDFSDIITNQVFAELQPKLTEKGFTNEESSEVYASVGRTVSANVRTLIDNIVKTYEQ
tara:strand:+ start:476 stop:682 length:207 start_codon:yes stop_codon:yes gene_type:complete